MCAAMPHAALQRGGEMGANNGYGALARPCSPAQVYCRGASWGGVKFGLLDILESPSEDNNWGVELSPGVVANSAKKRCSTLSRQEFP